MNVTILGCGTSSGVPRVDGDWGACDPNEPRNRRRRASILVEHGSARILVDTSPDLREQLLAEGGGRPSAVIWTHEHADHCNGMDDLRPFYFYGQSPMRGYAAARTLAALKTGFAYALIGHQGYPAYISASELPDVTSMDEIRVTSTQLPHGPITSTGLRFDVGGKSVAYFTDFHELPDEAAAIVDGIDLWIVDSVRRRPHPTHPHLAQVLNWIAAARPGRAILTHMDQSMDYRTLCAELPENVEPGYDGLVVTL